MSALMNFVNINKEPGKIGITIDLGKDMVELIAAIAVIVEVMPVIIRSVSVICGCLDVYLRGAYSTIGTIYENYTATPEPYADLVQEVVGESQSLVSYSIEN